MTVASEVKRAETTYELKIACETVAKVLENEVNYNPYQIVELLYGTLKAYAITRGLWAR